MTPVTAQASPDRAASPLPDANESPQGARERVRLYCPVGCAWRHLMQSLEAQGVAAFPMLRHGGFMSDAAGNLEGPHE